MNESHSGRPLLVLDLDEAIWHGVSDSTEPSGVHFALRPHLKLFLDTVMLAYDVAVWTAASEDWMQVGLEVVRLETGVDLAALAVFLWHRGHCTPSRSEDGEYTLVKHARKFRAGWIRSRYPRERILAVDDRASNYATGYGHLVKISEWTGQPDDSELLFLAAYLLSIADEPDLRAIEKRGWHSRKEGEARKDC